MQTISVNPYKDIRWADMKAELPLLTKETQFTMEVTSISSLANVFAVPPQIIDGNRSMSKKIGDLELNQCILDGSYVFPNHSDGQVGWRSMAVSDANCAISEYVELKPINVRTIVPGIMLYFDDKTGEYATDFDIVILNGATEVYRESVTNNRSLIYKFKHNINTYTAIRVEFRKTYAPFKRVKLAEIPIGIYETFDKKSIMEMTALFEFSPTTDALPSCELNIKMNNLDGDYSPFTGHLHSYLRAGIDIPLQIGVGETSDVKYVNRGRFKYTKSQTSEGNRIVSITANDQVLSLDDKIFDAGYLGTLSLSAAINYILTRRGDGSSPIGDILDYRIDSAVANRQVYMAIEEMTVREALRLVIQAARCWAFMGVDGYMNVVDGSIGGTVQTFTKDMLLEDPDLEIDSGYAEKSFKTYRYAVSSAETELGKLEETVSGQSISEVSQVFRHEAAASRRVVFTGGATLGSLVTVSSFMTIVRFFRPSAGGTYTVTLFGKPYEKIEESRLYNADTENPAIVPDGYGMNVGVVEDWYNAIADSRIEYPLKERGNPALEIKDAVNVDGRKALIYKQEYRWDGQLQCDDSAIEVD